MASSSWASSGPPAQVPDPAVQINGSGPDDRNRKPHQTRQLLSCTKCRERKVKCDRTKPCSACCARGHPKECEFVVGEGNDYSPIQQSYEIRKLRAENQRLRERLQAGRLAQSGDEDDNDQASDRKSSRSVSRMAASRQRRFRTGERVDNLYFGTPGLANIVSDFANLQIRREGSDSLTHTVPRGQDMYLPSDGQSAYPFPILWQGGNSLVDMARVLLTSRDDVFACLEMFQRRAQSCYFPHTPDEVTKKEVERFLADAEGNAQRYPDMLALIFATLATGMQMGVHDRHGGAWVPGAVEASRIKSDVYLAAAMQALRMASFMNTPTLLVIQTLLMIGPYLTNSGRFLDAWTLFGTTIRIAHSIGLHRSPRLLDPAPPLRESSIRRTLWWWMLHMDQQYSVTLGRPLGISGYGDCPPPEPLTTDPTILRLGEFVDHFTILARQILMSDGMMNVSRIDEYTDKLLGLWDTMPEALQFNETWVQQDHPLPDWPLEVMSATLFAKVQSFLILLNRQRVERTQAAVDASPPASMLPPPRPGSSSYGHSDLPLHPAPVRGRALVINSSIAILHAFLFFQHRNPAVLICWSMGQQAFNACMILLLDAWETENQQNEWLINEAFAVFSQLQQNGVHKLAELAVRRISDGLARLGSRQREREHAEMTRRSSGQGGYGFPPTLSIDTFSLPDFSHDAVMGNTGVFLLEDPGLQGYVPQSFQPLGWNMAGSAHPSNASNPPTPNIPSPIVPVSQATAATFPVMSPQYMSSTMPTLAPAPYSHNNNNLNQRMQPTQPRRPTFSGSGRGSLQQLAFTPINGGLNGSPHQHQHHNDASFPQARGPRHSQISPGRAHGSSSSTSVGAGPRGIHRLDRPPKSQPKRK